MYLIVFWIKILKYYNNVIRVVDIEVFKVSTLAHWEYPEKKNKRDLNPKKKITHPNITKQCLPNVDIWFSMLPATVSSTLISDIYSSMKVSLWTKKEKENKMPTSSAHSAYQNCLSIYFVSCRQSSSIKCQLVARIP